MWVYEAYPLSTDECEVVQTICFPARRSPTPPSRHFQQRSMSVWTWPWKKTRSRLPISTGACATPMQPTDRYNRSWNPTSARLRDGIPRASSKLEPALSGSARALLRLNLSAVHVPAYRGVQLVTPV